MQKFLRDCSDGGHRRELTRALRQQLRGCCRQAVRGHFNTALISGLLVIYIQKSCFVDKHSVYFNVRMPRWQRSDKCCKEEFKKITARRKQARGEIGAQNKPRAGTAVSVFKGKSLRNVTLNQKGRVCLTFLPFCPKVPGKGCCVPLLRVLLSPPKPADARCWLYYS